ncbi:putative bifunctional diguanylate cyclase/phosphodiesterase [Sandarakinorhabdus sp.]|uniref:putative bifunctional diguanylate cyclase/phosphodiesterase n=1 Tax=Sandarakinorhabdus sp. TaxID=1916663 RepID=UPI003F70EEB3
MNLSFDNNVPEPITAWQKWRDRLFGPGLPPVLMGEFTRAIGSYYSPFLVAGPVAAALAIAVAVSVGSTLALAFAAVALVGFGFILLACREALSPIGDDALPGVEARYALGCIMGSAGLGGIVLAVLAAESPMMLQTVVVMVALAALGVANGTGPGRPQVAAAQAICISVPMTLAIIVQWPWPWGLAAGIGVLVYGIICVSVARRSFTTQTELLHARERSRAERVRMDVAVAHLNQAMAILDEALRVVVVNRRALDLLGIEAIDTANPPSFPELLAGAPNLARSSGNREEFLAHAAMLVAARQQFNGVLRLNDDRVIDLECLPIPGGGWVSMLRDSTGERNAIAELNREIRRCPLTGLPNRRAFIEELEKRLGRGDEFALLLVDLDGFKQVNDRHGHAVGDRMMTRIGFRLRTADPALFAARLVGDEFAILAEVADVQAAEALGHRLIDTVDTPARFGEEEVQVGAAVGIAMAPGDGVLAESLLRAADLALLAAKLRPGNSLRRFTPELLQQSTSAANNEARVRMVLRAGTIDVAYQPMVDITTGRVVSVEALARWPDDGSEPLSADCLVAIAEARGLVGRLRRLVMAQAAATVAALPGDISLWVNASVLDLRSEAMVDEMMDALQTAGLSPGRLAVEITETALMTDEGACRTTLQRLCDMGAGVAMDDFGAGFSSLDRLRRLPINALKISGSLLTGTADNAVAADIFRVAAGLGQSMGLVVVAEGVESAEELALARSANIQRVQGFALSPPVSAALLPLSILRAEANARAALGLAAA